MQCNYYAIGYITSTIFSCREALMLAFHALSEDKLTITFHDFLLFMSEYKPHTREQHHPWLGSSPSLHMFCPSSMSILPLTPLVNSPVHPLLFLSPSSLVLFISFHSWTCCDVHFQVTEKEEWLNHSHLKTDSQWFLPILWHAKFHLDTGLHSLPDRSSCLSVCLSVCLLCAIY